MDTIVLYPAPGLGHLISMVELAKYIHRTNTTTNLIVLAAVPSFDTGSVAAFLGRASAEIPFVTFLQLPQIPVDRSKFHSGEAAVFQLLYRSNPHVRESLQSLKQSSHKISAFIIDFFCTCALPIGKQLEIPTYYFFSSNAACLALFFYTPTLLDGITENFKDMGEKLVNVPGIPPIPSSQMIKPLLVRGTQDFDGFLNICRSMHESDGIIVNTYEALEARAIKTLRDGGCNPNGRTPPIFCVGPIVKESLCDHECIKKWLDAQPKKSVVFLCFGSLGLHSARQLREMAVGLERSGLRFLWAVRAPPSEPDLDSFFPAGFLDRTRDRGLVVTTWVPRVSSLIQHKVGVLNHGSVGGFVSHCGWNSVVEAVWAGVPMMAWPLYAEQHFNRVLLVEELGLALRFKEEEDGFVTCDELEISVRELMESERGQRVRERVEEMSVEAKAAVAVGGSSYVALHKLVQAWKLTSS